MEKDERKQYRDHSSGTNEFDEPWIKDNAARDVLFCTRMRTMQALVYIYIYVCIYKVFNFRNRGDGGRRRENGGRGGSAKLS